jgi:LysM repeat protein
MTTYSNWDAVTVRRIYFPQASTNAPANIHRMLIVPSDRPDSGGVYVPYSPNEVTHTRGADYVDVSRVGRKPALVYKNVKRREMTMTLYLANKYRASVTPSSPTITFNADTLARTLTGWIEGGVRLRVAYGNFENGIWRITDMSIKTIRRGVTTNNFEQAEMTLTFTEVVDIRIGTGPVSGGVKPAPAKKPTAPKTRIYVMKKGDTLSKVSIKYYGTASKWRKLADANKIKNPNRIKVGYRLKIPK